MTSVNSIRTAFFPRGTVGLGQVMLVSNMHAFADEGSWCGGLVVQNQNILLNFAHSAAHMPPLFPVLCRPPVIAAAYEGDLSQVIKLFKYNPELEGTVRFALVEEDEEEDAPIQPDVRLFAEIITRKMNCHGILFLNLFLFLFLTKQADTEQYQAQLAAQFGTALHAAAAGGSIPVLRYLLEVICCH